MGTEVIKDRLITDSFVSLNMKKKSKKVFDTKSYLAKMAVRLREHSQAGVFVKKICSLTM